MRGGGHYFDSDEYTGKGYDWRYVRRLLTYAWPHRKLIVLALVFMLFTTAAQLMVPYIFKTAIDSYIAKLYEVYTCSEQNLSALTNAASPEVASEIIHLDQNRIAVLPRVLGKIPGARQVFLKDAVKNPTNFFLFSTNYYTGNSGYITSNIWLVPEGQISSIPPKVLTEMRGSDLRGILVLAGALFVLLFLRMFTEYGHTYSITLAGQRAMYDLRMAAYGHLQKLSLAYFTRNPVGRLVTRVTNDIQAINEVIASLLVNLIKEFLVFIGAIIIIFMMNVKLALIALSMLPLFVVVVIVFRPKVRRAWRRIRRDVAKINATLTEDISGVKIVQIFTQQDRRHKEFKELNSNYFKSNMHQMVLFGIFRPLIDMLRSFGTALILVFGGLCIINGSLTLGSLVAFFAYLRELYNPITSVSQQVTALQGAMAAAERIFGLIDEEPDVMEHPNPAVITETSGRVEFEHVDFSYLEDTPVLRDVSFTVEPGKSIAIVGPTGAGKSSIINLICRFYDPQSGCVRLDGIDIRNWSFDQLSRHIAIVLQDAFIFSRDIESNIRLGRTDIPREKILEAAEMVQAQQFIENLPGGYDEMMMERGATLSSGQKQLLCFARALAHDPKVLILDEATSNVDPATEQLIQHAIETLMAGRTSIIVAHRLSTIEKVDEILVMDNGRILERGNHRELMDKRGIYYNLYLLQFTHAA